jgi:ABC-type sulfate transport system substrate-binding protein
MKNVYSFHYENKTEYLDGTARGYDSVDVVVMKNGKELYREKVSRDRKSGEYPHDAAFALSRLYQERGRAIIASYEAEDYKIERSEIIAEFAERFPQFENDHKAIMEMIADKVIQYMRERS